MSVTKKTPAQLIKIAADHQDSAIEAREASEKKYQRAVAIREKIAEMTKRAQELEFQSRVLWSRSSEHDYAASELLNEARLAYTANMDGPSEERAASWNAFIEASV